MYNNGIDMRVLVNGRAFKEYSHKGLSFIEAKHGTNYTVKIKNDNAFRVMAVLSVDGLDVISGKPAEDADKGYVVDAYSYVEIKGYRISDGNSAAFIFAAKGEHHVAKASDVRSRNCGVIGVRIFKEKEAPAPAPTVVHHYHATYVPNPVPVIHPWNPWSTNGYFTTTGGPICTAGNSGISYGVGGTTCNNGMPVQGGMSVQGAVSSVNASYTVSTDACFSSDVKPRTKGTLRSMSPSHEKTLNKSPQLQASNAFDDPISYKQFDTGTGWGKKLDDKVKKVQFDVGPQLTELVLYYATKSALINMGVEFEDDARIVDNDPPRPFGKKYCEPPKGWNG